MKTPPEHPPVRFVDLPSGQDPAQLGRLIRSVTDAPTDTTPAVKWRIRNTLYRKAERQRRVLRFALVGVFMFVAGGVVGAAVRPIFPILMRRSAGLAPPKETGPARTGDQTRKRRPVVQAPAVETPAPDLTQAASESAALPVPPPTVTPPSIPPSSPAPAAPTSPSTDISSVARPIARPSAGQTTATPQPRRLATNERHLQPDQPAARGTRHAPSLPTLEPAAGPTATPALPPPASLPFPPQPSATPEPPQLPDEQALLATALRKLRTTHEPEAALALLDTYAVRFPSGALAPEAARLRTEALLRAGRKSAVLPGRAGQAAVGRRAEQRRAPGGAG
jgi:hypothetical protein